MTRSTIVLLIMLALGLHALVTGLRYRFGYFKSPYFARPTLTMYAELGVSGGFLFLILSISSLLTRDIDVSVGLTTAVSLLTYLALAALAANWLLSLIGSNLWQPAWVIWLESHYNQTQIGQLRQQAQEIGLKQWENQVMTQHDLEQWITAVLTPPPSITEKSASSAKSANKPSS
ncbi:MAG: hypothetical protein H6658_17950 [Ardenticatenaceae bacterium]|nr:hypothetical protein [Ardenticatenaceae bacterium]